MIETIYILAAIGVAVSIAEWSSENHPEKDIIARGLFAGFAGAIWPCTLTYIFIKDKYS